MFTFPFSSAAFDRSIQLKSLLKVDQLSVCIDDLQSPLFNSINK